MRTDVGSDQPMCGTLGTATMYNRDVNLGHCQCILAKSKNMQVTDCVSAGDPAAINAWNPYSFLRNPVNTSWADSRKAHQSLARVAFGAQNYSR
ncbi:hypothetical protein NPIL_552141 [Nephila pilipes]|uniref:Uncharacterized protein n=1 Tax=Nephila pilipes TaxID=299642 RepID=A0A8X6T7R4_NEPPI|nr:hypothetical protein NPIL_552141 [Nephila pilipes]